VVQKRLPLLPSEEQAAAASSGPDVEQLVSTRTFKAAPGTLMSAVDTTVYSHAQQLNTIRTVDPFLRTTYKTYGSRLPIEVGHIPKGPRRL
jgi:hypothetical protein